MNGLRQWLAGHPRLTGWALLSLGMVAAFLWASADAGLTGLQRAGLAILTVGLAGLCVIITWWES